MVISDMHPLHGLEEHVHVDTVGSDFRKQSRDRDRVAVDGPAQAEADLGSECVDKLAQDRVHESDIAWQQSGILWCECYVQDPCDGIRGDRMGQWDCAALSRGTWIAWYIAHSRFMWCFAGFHFIISQL